MISNGGLRDLSERLKYLDIERAESEVMAQAARDIELRVEAELSASNDANLIKMPGNGDMPQMAIPSRLAPGGAVIGLAHRSAAGLEFGTPSCQPLPLLITAARQLGPTIAERIGETFARILAGS